MYERILAAANKQSDYGDYRLYAHGDSVVVGVNDCGNECFVMIIKKGDVAILQAPDNIYNNEFVVNIIATILEVSYKYDIDLDCYMLHISDTQRVNVSRGVVIDMSSKSAYKKEHDWMHDADSFENNNRHDIVYDMTGQTVEPRLRGVDI